MNNVSVRVCPGRMEASIAAWVGGGRRPTTWPGIPSYQNRNTNSPILSLQATSLNPGVWRGRVLFR